MAYKAMTERNTGYPVQSEDWNEIVDNSVAVKPVAMSLILSAGALTSGYKGHVQSPINFGIATITTAGTNAGNGTIDIYVGGTLPLGTANSICGAAPIAFAGTAVNIKNTFAGWTGTAITAGQWIGINVSGAATISAVTMSIEGNRT